jgi:hypothetical protein
MLKFLLGLSSAAIGMTLTTVGFLPLGIAAGSVGAAIQEGICDVIGESILFLLGLFSAAAGMLLTLYGFTPLGIAAGSAAAVFQAGIGDVIAGSAFAILQSVGAQGGFAALTAGGVATALITACSDETETVE